MYYVDHTRPPWVDIALPSAIILPAAELIALYAIVLCLDLTLLCHEQHLHKYITAKQLRIGMAIVHVFIPMIFISNHPPCNILFAGAPWFMASYSAHMPTDQLTLQKCVHALFKVTINDDETMKTKTKIRYKGIAKVSLGVLKLVFMKIIINSLLPHHADDALEYAWLHPMSLIYTVLFGIKAYCLLGAVDVFMGIEQVVFAWDLVDLFDSPIIATSPRDFWSRRWNKVVRNLLHTQVFTARTNVTPSKKSSKAASRLADKQDKNNSFWSCRQGRGLLSFIISGIFHELIIMSACRRITLENLAFFTFQGLAVMLEVELRQSALKQEPQGTTRIKCIALQLLFMSLTGRLFTAPFLRYGFFTN